MKIHEYPVMLARSTFFFGLFTLCSWNVQADTTPVGSAISHNLINTVYRPLHGTFNDLAEAMANETIDLCERRPSSSGYRLQADFTHLIEAFSAIEFFRLGPLLDDNRKNRLFYWPDKRRVAERQLKDLLSNPEVATLAAEQLAQKSVALQGFTALERLLFTDDMHPLEEGAQCHLIPLIIRNIANMASQLNSAWLAESDYVRSLLQPQAGSEYFRSTDEVVRSVYTQAKVGLDIVLVGKLAPLLSDNPKDFTQTPMWLSQRSITMITGNLRGLRALVLNSGLLAGSSFQEDLRVDFDYIDHILKKLKYRVRLEQPNGELDPEVRILINQLAAVVGRIRYVVSVDVAESLGIRAGYNSEDGD